MNPNCVHSTPSVDELREALVKGQRDAESEYRRAQTGTEAETYHNGRMVAYMDAIEAFDLALAATPTPAPAPADPFWPRETFRPLTPASAERTLDVEALSAQLDLHWMDWNPEMQTATCSCGGWQFDADRDIQVGEHFAPFSRHVAAAIIEERSRE